MASPILQDAFNVGMACPAGKTIVTVSDDSRNLHGKEAYDVLHPARDPHGSGAAQIEPVHCADHAGRGQPLLGCNPLVGGKQANRKATFVHGYTHNMGIVWAVFWDCIAATA